MRKRMVTTDLNAGDELMKIMQALDNLHTSGYSAADIKRVVGYMLNDLEKKEKEARK